MLAKISGNAFDSLDKLAVLLVGNRTWPCSMECLKLTTAQHSQQFADFLGYALSLNSRISRLINRRTVSDMCRRTMECSI
ncbi:unnamed protein product [Caenorhabditis sp. 36 PRJEB53466]|nr:unnamed protein product [Caenorhabditis sp. 36 PRJEB53466]